MYIFYSIIASMLEIMAFYAEINFDAMNTSLRFVFHFYIILKICKGFAFQMFILCFELYLVFK